MWRASGVQKVTYLHSFLILARTCPRYTGCWGTGHHWGEEDEQGKQRYGQIQWRDQCTTTWTAHQANTVTTLVNQTRDPRQGSSPSPSPPPVPTVPWKGAREVPGSSWQVCSYCVPTHLFCVYFPKVQLVVITRGQPMVKWKLQLLFYSYLELTGRPFQFTRTVCTFERLFI